jgi:hypothetical protein
MYNFAAHTLNGVAVSYSSLPNFALDIIERDERLTLASKLIYIRLLRYASMIKQTAFKITGSWLVQNVVIDRRTVSRSIVQLKQCGYMTDNGIVIPDMTGIKKPTQAPIKTDTAPKAEPIKAAQSTPELTTNKHDAADMLRALVGLRTSKITKDDDVDMLQKAAQDDAKSSIECCKKQHPIKNKEKNKEKNKAMPENSDTTQTTGPVKTMPNTRPVKTTATKLSVLIERSHLGGGDVGSYDSTFKGYGDQCHASANMGGASHA